MITIEHLPTFYQKQVLMMVNNWTPADIRTQWRLHMEYSALQRKQGYEMEDGGLVIKAFMAALTHLVTGIPLKISNDVVRRVAV